MQAGRDKDDIAEVTDSYSTLDMDKTFDEFLEKVNDLVRNNNRSRAEDSDDRYSTQVFTALFSFLKKT